MEINILCFPTQITVIIAAIYDNRKILLFYCLEHKSARKVKHLVMKVVYVKYYLQLNLVVKCHHELCTIFVNHTLVYMFLV